VSGGKAIWAGSSPGGAYTEKLTTMAKPGTVAAVVVRHDDWCALLGGHGPCNCQPEVEVLPPVGPVAGPLESALLATLATGPAPAWRLAEELGQGVDRVLALLRDMRRRGLVASGPDAQGVTAWRLAP